MFNILQLFNNKAEARESKDEQLVGEIVRAFYRMGCPAVGFRNVGNDRQILTFVTRTDAVLHRAYIVLDRKTGGGALSEMIIGNKATLTLGAEIKNQLTDPDDLVAMVKTDLANMFKLPVMGGVKLDHRLNTVYARTTLVIDIDDYLKGGPEGAQKLQALLVRHLDPLREALRPFKRG
jgi:hypothetical protein